MKKRDLRIGDVVQIDPGYEGSLFKGAFMVVTDPEAWGAVGFIACEFNRESMPARAYYRATWDRMEYVGPATWVLSSEGAEI